MNRLKVKLQQILNVSFKRIYDKSREFIQNDPFLDFSTMPIMFLNATLISYYFQM